MEPPQYSSFFQLYARNVKRKIKKAPRQAKITEINTIIRPKVEYASVIWDPLHKGKPKEVRESAEKSSRIRPQQ